LAARLSESLRISAEAPAPTTQITVTMAGDSERAISAALRADWDRVASLEACALHYSLNGDALVAHAQWSGTAEGANECTRAAAQRVLQASPGCSVEVHCLTLDSVRAAHSSRGGASALTINAQSTAPVLIAAFNPVQRGRDALLHYLHEASARFATTVKGWLGAALYCDADGGRLVEYLQFENMEGIAASQGSPLIQAHQVELQKFGAFNANLYMIRDVYKRRAN
jgi:hypothetical protein